MVDEMVEKSENRVVAAIADLKADLKADMNDMKADIRTVNQKVDSLASDVIYVRTGLTTGLADLRVEIANVKVGVGNRLRQQTLAVVGLVLSMFFALAGYMTWLINS